MLLSAAVTFTLMTVSPTATGNWKSSFVVSASVSVMSLPSRYSIVARESPRVGVTVTESTLPSTLAAYAYVSDAKVGVRVRSVVPSLTTSPLSVLVAASPLMAIFSGPSDELQAAPSLALESLVSAIDQFGSAIVLV